MLNDLPVALLGAVFRCLADLDNLGCLAPVLNLVCRATNEALPDVFTASEPASLDNKRSSNGDNHFSDAFGVEGSEDQGSASPPVLQLNLTRLSRAVFDNRVSSLLLQRTGLRFAHTRCLRLVATHHFAAHGSALFAEHVAPHMTAVRSLFIQGPLSLTLAPFWQLSSFASLAAAVHELHLEGHHSSLTPFAAQLPDHFPALNLNGHSTLNALRLVVYADDHSDRMLLNPISTGFSALSVRVSPHLASLLLSVKMPDGQEYIYDDRWGGQMKDDPFTLTVTGDPRGLRRLHIDTWAMPKETGSYAHFRPWTLLGTLPALQHLDVSLEPDYIGAAWPGAPAAGPAFRMPLHQTCPGLRSLVLRSGLFSGVATWQPVVTALAPLAATLVCLDLHVVQPHPATVGRRPPVVSRANLRPLVERVLPLARLSVFGEHE